MNSHPLKPLLDLVQLASSEHIDQTNRMRANPRSFPVEIIRMRDTRNPIYRQLFVAMQAIIGSPEATAIVLAEMKKEGVYDATANE